MPALVYYVRQNENKTRPRRFLTDDGLDWNSARIRYFMLRSEALAAMRALNKPALRLCCRKMSDLFSAETQS